MLLLLAICVAIWIGAGVAILLLKTLLKTLDADVLATIRILILVFAGVATVVVLWNGRAAFGLH